jgi:chaperone required for assembly of F1-ATPase
MSTDEFLSLFGGREPFEPRDPMKAAQGTIRPPRPKRFFKNASTERGIDGWRLLLDGKPARTPARRLLSVDDERIARALAAEWDAQPESLDPLLMPLTRLVNSALDGVAEQASAVREEIVRYAGSDLVCYRAEAPKALAEAQEAAWDPLVSWAREALGATLWLTAGVLHVAQADEALKRVAAAVAAVPSPLKLAALSAATTISGSAIIALALAHGRLGPDEAWTASNVDEDYQARIWGHDEEAVFRQDNRRRDFGAAAFVLQDSPSGLPES